MNHKQKKKNYRMFMQSAAWRKIKKERIELDSHTCQGCGECGTPWNGLTVHHLNYERFGGDEKMEDLMTLCKSCHGDLEYADKFRHPRKIKPTPKPETP